MSTCNQFDNAIGRQFEPSQIKLLATPVCRTEAVKTTLVSRVGRDHRRCLCTPDFQVGRCDWSRFGVHVGRARFLWRSVVLLRLVLFNQFSSLHRLETDKISCTFSATPSRKMSSLASFADPAALEHKQSAISLLSGRTLPGPSFPCFAESSVIVDCVEICIIRSSGSVPPVTSICPSREPVRGRFH